MIREYEMYHGAVMARLLHSTKREVNIKAFSKSNNSSYVINNEIGLYLKYSSKRLSPWSFSFKKKHQLEIAKMFTEFKKVYLVLICHTDGVVTLSFNELKKLLDHIHEPTEWIRVSRHKREKYSVSGKDGKLNYKIGKSEFPEKLFN